MSLTPFIHPSKKSTPLVEIHYGTAFSVYASLSKSPVIWGGNTYFPEPSIDVDLPKQSGGLSEEACKIKLPRDGAQHPGISTLSNLLASPRTSLPMSVRVINLIESGPDDLVAVVLYEGVDTKTVRNPQGQEGFVQLEIVPEFRYQLEDVTLGTRADPTCGHPFGGVGCWHPDVDTFISSGDAGNPVSVRKIHVTMSMSPVVSSRSVQIFVDPAFHPWATPTVITVRPENWWKRAFLEKDGLRISISDWRWNATLGIGTDQFILNRIPPEDWHLGKAVLHPGCTRTAEACSQRLNTLRFGAYGHGIPAYNPTLETRDN